MIASSHVGVFLNGTQVFLEIGKKLEMMKIMVKLLLHELKKKFRKCKSLSRKIYICMMT